MAIPPNLPTLRVKIRNKGPVELNALGDAFRSLADEYSHYVEFNTEATLAPDVRLYVAKVRAGSILTDLVALAPAALPFIENSVSIIDFASYAKSAFEFLLGRRGEHSDLSRRSLENFNSLLEPVAKDSGSQLIVQTIVQGDVNVHLHLNSVEANAVQNAIRRKLTPVREARSGRQEKVLLYLHQARNDVRSTVGDRGIIESIAPTPVKITFANEALKGTIIHGSDNPFRKAFVVDVEVGTVNGRPALYNIVALHDTVERPEAA